MENSFIDQIIQKLSDEKTEWKDTLVLFPNRRPAAFFKKVLAEKSQRPIWSPEIKSIDDFITEHIQLGIPDRLTLIMELWKVYVPLADEHGMETSIDQFFPIGETLLNDFDHIDRNLVSTEALFANVAELKALEDRFEPKEQIQELQKFWAHFSDKELSHMKAEFRKIWQQI